MRSRVVIGFFVFVAAGVLFGMLTKNPASKIEVKEEIVNLGRVGTGRTYSGVFVLVNKGRLPLEVELQKVSCACTVTEMCKSPINQNEKGTITAYISAPESEEPFGSKIILRTNDPQRPKVVLRIQGIAETVMRATPPAILFGDVPVDMLPKTKRFAVRPGKLATPNMLAHLRIDSKNEHIEVTANTTPEEVDVVVTLCEGVPIGALRSSIVVGVEVLNNYSIDIPIIAQVTGDYKIYPGSLFYGKVSPGVGVTRKCYIKPLNKGDTIEIVDGDYFDKTSLKINVEYGEGQATVKALLQAKSRQGTFEDALKLKLMPENGEQPQYFQIPIIYVVQSTNSRGD